MAQEFTQEKKKGKEKRRLKGEKRTEMLHYKSRFQTKSTKNLRNLKNKTTDKSFPEARYKVSEGSTR